MLDFHPITLADKDLIDAYVREEDSRSADFNFGNMLLWDHVFTHKGLEPLSAPGWD